MLRRDAERLKRVVRSIEQGYTPDRGDSRARARSAVGGGLTRMTIISFSPTATNRLFARPVGASDTDPGVEVRCIVYASTGAIDVILPAANVIPKLVVGLPIQCQMQAWYDGDDPVSMWTLITPTLMRAC